MKFKRLTAALSALAVVVSSAGGLPFGGLRLFDTSVVASAEEKSVTFTATGTQDGITVSCRAYMRDSFFVNGSASKLTISSGSENITKLEITDSAMYPDRFTESHITVSAGNKSIQGGVLTVTDINAKSVTLSATDNKYWTTNKIVVYYGESAVDPVYTITIPESVNIDGGKAEFKAENVTLPDGAKINITVDGKNTESGQTTFNAKNEAGNSTVSYTIKNGSADVADGGIALTFTEGGTQTLSFAKKADSTPTYAGKHTETLTFGISVAEYVPSLADAFEDGALINVTLSVHGVQQTYSFKNENGIFTPPAGTANYYRPKVGLKKEDSGSLVVEASGYVDYSLQTARSDNCLCIYTFDTQSNKYSYVKQAKVIDEAEFVSISVNGTEIPVTQA